MRLRPAVCAVLCLALIAPLAGCGPLGPSKKSSGGKTPAAVAPSGSKLPEMTPAEADAYEAFTGLAPAKGTDPELPEGKTACARAVLAGSDVKVWSSYMLDHAREFFGAAEKDPARFGFKDAAEVASAKRSALGDTKPIEDAILHGTDAQVTDLMMGDNGAASFLSVPTTWIGELARLAIDDPTGLDVRTREGGVAIMEFTPSGGGEPLTLELRFVKKGGKWKLRELLNLPDLMARMAAAS